MSILYLHPNSKKEIIDSYDEDIIVTNREGIIVKATQISGRHYGFHAKDLLGKSVYDLEREKIFTPAITPLVLKQKKKVVIVQTAPGGKKVLITGMPFYDAKGEVQFVISYSYEVSELLVIQEYMKDLEDEMRRAKGELSLLRKENLSTDNLIIESRSTIRAYETAKKVAPLDVSIMLYGEYGTGKTTLAKVIHKNSARKNAPFIEVNFESLPEALFETELFGDEEKPGILNLANHGTLYLNGIDKLSPFLQSKLVTILRDKKFTPINSTKFQTFDVRLISSAEQTLTSDLHYLLHIVPIHLEPLRERKEDLCSLLSKQLIESTKKYGINKKLSNEIFDYLLTLEWNGNHFELANLLERLVVQSDTSIISLNDLPAEYYDTSDDGFSNLKLEGRTLPNILESVEMKVLKNAQNRYRTTTEMAKHLGISQPSVVRKLKKYMDIK